MSRDEKYVENLIQLIVANQVKIMKTLFNSSDFMIV